MSPSTLRPVRASLAVATLAALYWIVVLAILGAGPPHPLDDVWEDGLAARQLLAGHGFRTTMIYPPLWTLRDPATMTGPLEVHGPWLPSALALPLRLWGPGLLDHLDWAAAAVAVVIALQVFRLGSRWFGAPVGVAAALLWTFAPILLQAVAHSLSVVVGAVLLMTALDLIARDRARPLLAGLALGIGYGARPELLVAVPVLAAYVGGRGSEGLWRAGRVGVGFLAVAGAWWWHQAATTGMPFFNLSSYMLLGSTPAHPGTTLMRDFGAPPANWPTIFRAELPTLWTKWVPLVPRAARHLLTGLGASLGWLVVAGAWGMIAAPDRRREAGLVILVAMIPIGMMILANPTKLYLVPFLGLIAVAAAR